MGYIALTIGCKQGCSLSPIVFSLCIDNLEQMVAIFVKEDGIEEVVIKNVIIMLLERADDLVLFANTLRDVHWKSFTCRLSFVLKQRLCL